VSAAVTSEPAARVLRDVRQLGPLDRWRAADRARLSYDIELPPLSHFNTAPCPRHAANGGLSASCGACGIALRRHQRVGATWLYARSRAFLADSVGTGKTAQVAWMLAACKETGELGPRNRAVIICQAAAVLDPWVKQLRRLLPGIAISAAIGTVAQRVQAYLAPWEVMVVSDKTFTPKRGKKVRSDGDISYLEQFRVGIVIYDDIDAMRNHRNRTAWAIKRFARGADRVVGLHGTPAQKRVVELHSQGEPIGITEALGSLPVFRARYVREGQTWFYQRGLVCEDDHLNPAGHRHCEHQDNPGAPVCGKHLVPDPTGRKVRRSVVKDIGVKNIPEFRAMIAPYVLRRRAADVNDANLPAMQRNTVWLEPSPRQRERYAELRRGMLRRLRESGEEITRSEAAGAFLRGQQICSNLANLDDGRDDSVKLDWVTDILGGDLSEEKAVVFCYFKPTVQALSDRLHRDGIGHVLFWGNEQDHQERARRLERFREDPDCRVLVGTSSIERSLNLQVARHLICVDTIMNPSRMEQLAGRIRRQGSVFPMIFVHFLWLRGTQEEGYELVLTRESSAISAAWGDTENELWGAAMTPVQMARLVAGV
jgi:SNF2 family DNA or RNA helicase